MSDGAAEYMRPLEEELGPSEEWARRRLWCWRCGRRTFFPSLHYLLHIIDVLRDHDHGRT